MPKKKKVGGEYEWFKKNHYVNQTLDIECCLTCTHAYMDYDGSLTCTKLGEEYESPFCYDYLGRCDLYERGGTWSPHEEKDPGGSQ